jgi:alpha-1,2-mannosyltransferase
LNILLYNAIGGSGDELYGVEPATYYLLNLTLNAGLAWPLALLSPLAVLVRCIQTGGCPIPLGQGGVVDPEGLKRLFDGLVVLTQAGIWLGILFSRPHKVCVLLHFMYEVQ